MAPRLAWLSSKVEPRAGKMSPRITNENADATRAMQLATNRRRGFMQSISGAGGPSSHGRGGLDISRELFLDNRVAGGLPGGTRPRSIASRSARIEEARVSPRPGGSRLVAFPAILLGRTDHPGRAARRRADPVLGRRRPAPPGALEFHGGFSRWLAKRAVSRP